MEKTISKWQYVAANGKVSFPLVLDEKVKLRDSGGASCRLMVGPNDDKWAVVGNCACTTCVRVILPMMDNMTNMMNNKPTCVSVIFVMMASMIFSPLVG